MTRKMIYLNEDHLMQLGTNWDDLIGIMKQVLVCLYSGDFAQPRKPYLRYRNSNNRIIAMPAFTGGEINSAGIKWIASFPANIEKGITRANAVTILNEVDTGIPICIINTSRISAVRTAAVTGLMLQEYISIKHPGRNEFKIGITGFGPIGQMHLEMLTSLMQNNISVVKLFDLRPVNRNTISESYRHLIQLEDSWQSCYNDADIFITCTVSSSPYIDIVPKRGSLHLNISLRDYKAETRKYFNHIIVDDWNEICRENTDIENMHIQQGLQPADTWRLDEFVVGHKIAEIDTSDVLMFNPMGMAVFDIAAASFYYRKAKELNVGTRL